MNVPGHTLILGGARSGKSAFAERLALSQCDSPLYLATSRVWDKGHQDRIDQHKSRRDERWSLVEEPLALGQALSDATHKVILVDCLSLWVTNLMFAEMDVVAEAAKVCEALPKLDAQVIFVSNEVGMGVHPETELGNRFRDLAGLVNQQFAKAANRVDFVIAGLPLSLKNN